jgi:16S rRNA processing protein RimM
LSDYYLIGKLQAVNNPDGYLSVEPFSDFPERFFNLKSVFIGIYGVYKKIFIEESIFENSGILIKFFNFDSDLEAGPLVGCSIYIDQSELIELEENSFFIHDLIGCRIYKEGKFFGVLSDVIQLTSNDVYVIDNDGKEFLLPAVKDFIQHIDIGSKEIFLTNNADLLGEDEI